MLETIKAEYSTLMSAFDSEKPVEAKEEKATISDTIKALQEK